MFSDRELIARLVQCEAGSEGETGMKAVATVIMNRVNSTMGEYARVSQDGNIRNIIYQTRQFNCVTETLNGSYNKQNIYNMNPTDIHYEIADWALSGNKINIVGDALWFMNPYSEDCPYEFPYNGSGVLIERVNNHCFYRPTELCYNT